MRHSTISFTALVTAKQTTPALSGFYLADTLLGEVRETGLIGALGQCSQCAHQSVLTAAMRPVVLMKFLLYCSSLHPYSCNHH